MFLPASAYLVIAVHHTPAQQDQDVGQKIVAERAEPGHGRDGGRPDRGVLQQDPVVDEPDVAGRVGGARPLLPQQVEDAHGEAGVLAVLDKLAQVGQAWCFNVMFYL